MCSLPQLGKSVCDLPSCEISDYPINSPFHLAGRMVAQPSPYSKLGMEEGDGEGVRVSQAMGAGCAWQGLTQGVTGCGCWLCTVGSLCHHHHTWRINLSVGGWEIYFDSVTGAFSLSRYGLYSRQLIHDDQSILQMLLISCWAKKQRRKPKAKQSKLQKPTSYFSSQHLPPDISKAFSKTTTLRRADIGKRT